MLYIVEGIGSFGAMTYELLCLWFIGQEFKTKYNIGATTGTERYICEIFHISGILVHDWLNEDN